MPSYRTPGVYIEEIPQSPPPITGVATAVTAFVGATCRGPANTPVLINSWDEYVAQFGDFPHRSGSTKIPAGLDAMGLAVLSFYQNGGKAAYICRMVQSAMKAAGGTVLTKDDTGADAPASATDYMHFYNNTLHRYRDIAIIVLPGQYWPAEGTGNPFITHTIAHCESTMSRVVIVDPENIEFTDAAQVDDMNFPTSSYAVLYYPWVRIPDGSATVSIPSSAIAAAIWAKTDDQRGVWKSPAGVEAGINVSSLEWQVENQEQDFLNQRGVNCIRNFRGDGPLLWGARTLASRAEPEWQYISVRRTAIFIEQSIHNGIQWATSKPNDRALWDALKMSVNAFMADLFRAGAFPGQSGRQAYFVRCGLRETMTQADLGNGQVIIEVGFAPLKPAEFVVLRIRLKVDQLKSVRKLNI